MRSSGFGLRRDLQETHINVVYLLGCICVVLELSGIPFIVLYVLLDTLQDPRPYSEGWGDVASL